VHLLPLQRQKITFQAKSVGRLAAAAAAMIERAPNTLSDVDLFSFSLLRSTMSAKSLSLSLSTQHVIEKRKIDVFNGNADVELCARTPWRAQPAIVQFPTITWKCRG
jgi:hypothetical protein